MSNIKLWSKEWRVDCFGAEHLVTVENHHAQNLPPTHSLWLVRVKAERGLLEPFWIFRYRNNRPWIKGAAETYNLTPDVTPRDPWGWFCVCDDFGPAVMAEIQKRGAEWLLKQSGLMLVFD